MQTRRVVSFALACLFAGCSHPAATTGGVDPNKQFTSKEATLLDFEFDGELQSDSIFGDGKNAIEDQLLYTIGHLNQQRSVGRLDRVELTNVKIVAADGDAKRVT